MESISIGSLEEERGWTVVVVVVASDELREGAFVAEAERETNVSMEV